MKRLICSILGVTLTVSLAMAEQPSGTIYDKSESSLLWPTNLYDTELENREQSIARMFARVAAGRLDAMDYLVDRLWFRSPDEDFSAYLKLREERAKDHLDFHVQSLEIIRLLDIKEPLHEFDLLTALRKAAMEGNKDAQRYACVNIATIREEQNIDYCHALAAEGDLDTQYALATIYLHHVDSHKRFGIERHNIGNRHWFDDLAIPIDAQKGVDMLKELAVQGHIKSHARLTYVYLEGEGALRDDDQAYVHAATAAEAGNWEGKRWLGLLHFSGRGVPETGGPTNEQVVKHLMDAASHGDAISQLMLANVYANGLAWAPTEDQPYTSRVVDAMVWGEVYRRRTDKEHLRLRTFDVDELKTTLQHLRFFETKENLEQMFAKLTEMALGGALTATRIKGGRFR